jgi:hypothetical protein
MDLTCLLYSHLKVSGFWGKTVMYIAMARTSENFEITLGQKLLRWLW